MVLVWELNFLRNSFGEQKIMFSRSYENGIYCENLSELSQEKIIFINYVGLFPAKDIVRIKLGKKGEIIKSNQYSFYYIDKTYFEQGFLGVFGVSEYNENNPFDWPETELVGRFVFSEYMKRFLDKRLFTSEGSQEYIDFLNSNLVEYFREYCSEKQIYLDCIINESKNNLHEAFQNMAACKEMKEKEKKEKKHTSKKQSDIELLPMSKLRDISPQITESILKIENIDEKDLKWMKFQRKFEFMLINEYGNPLTKIMSFVNGLQQAWGSEDEQNDQSLEGMTYSVLKSFVEQQNQTLEYIQVRKASGAGFEFILFHTFKMGDISYLIIMNVDNFDPETNFSISSLNGDEEKTLDRIIRKLKEHEDWFTSQGEVFSSATSFEIESLFYRECKKNFQ